jgi:hypothetical protein
MQLLSVRPGVTDAASIVFADEGEILKGSADPDGLYDAVIRPWKNRLALLYVRHRSMATDLELIALTIMTLPSRRAALAAVDRMIARWGAPSELRRICARSDPLPAGEPPGEILCW